MRDLVSVFAAPWSPSMFVSKFRSATALTSAAAFSCLLVFAPLAGATAVGITGTTLDIGYALDTYQEDAAHKDAERSVTVSGGANGSVRVVETGAGAVLTDADGPGGCVVNEAMRTADCPSSGLLLVKANNKSTTSSARFDFSALDSLPVHVDASSNESGDPAMELRAAASVVIGGPGDDVLDLVRSVSGYGEGYISVTTGEAYGGSGNDTITGAGKASGGPGDDHIGSVEGSQNSAIGGSADGGPGMDRIELYRDAVGGSGNDKLLGIMGLAQGGDGNDVLTGTSDCSQCAGLGDNGSFKTVLRGGPGNDTLTGAVTAYGDAGNDRITYAKSAAFGGGGDDIMTRLPGFASGGDGNDLLVGGMICTATLHGSPDLPCTRWVAKSRLHGNAGNDRIQRAHLGYGDAGNDLVATINMRTGDVANGGLGRDTCPVDRGDQRTACEIRPVARRRSSLPGHPG